MDGEEKSTTCVPTGAVGSIEVSEASFVEQVEVSIRGVLGARNRVRALPTAPVAPQIRVAIDVAWINFGDGL